MFEVAELGQQIDEDAYAGEAHALQLALLALQQRLRDSGSAVLVVFAGGDAAGKGETANVIARWLDARYVQVTAYDAPSDEERDRPEFWRFWRDLPKSGRVGMVLSSWYSGPVLGRVRREMSRGDFHDALDRIAGFERTLADNGVLVVKFWMHLSKQAQKRRLRKLERDPRECWRVTDETWDNYDRHDRFVAAAEDVVRRTGTGHAPWHIVEGADRRYRELEVARRLESALRAHLDLPPPAGDKPTPAGPTRRTVLDGVVQATPLDKSSYREAIEVHGGRLARLSREARRRKLSPVLVFEGWDAAGKGSAIKRLTDVLDARDYRVHPIAAPSEDERRYPYLWRFWTRLERAGKITIFDRSWYGRVLVERVEGFASEEAWRRAYTEIRQFEDQLVESGRIVVKYWLHVSDAEQLKRFDERARSDVRGWKLTDDDWRNRAKRPAYEAAIDEMIEHTSTGACPWTLVAADDKYAARVTVLRTLVDQLEAAL